MTETNSKKGKHKAPPVTLRGTLTAISCGVAVGLAIITILAGYAGRVDPRHIPMAGMLCMAYPLCLIVNLLFMIPCYIIGKRLCAIGIAALLITLPAALDYSPLNLGHLREPEMTPELKAKTFTMVSYNALNFASYDGVKDMDGRNETIRYLCDTGADILVLQEVMSLWRSPNEDISQADIDTLKSCYPYSSIPIKQQIISAVFSKYPITIVPMFKDRENDPKGFAVKVHFPDSTKVTIANLHLQSLGLSDDDKQVYRELVKGDVDRKGIASARGVIYRKLADAFCERAEQADELRKFALASASGENLIVTGDFNDVQGCYAIRRIEEGTGLRSVYREIGFGPRVTYYSNHFLFRIDHTLYRGNITPIYYSIDQSFRKSDHFPTKTIFMFK